MIVFLAGMQRSGSTFAFNVARDILERRGCTYHEASADIIGALSRAENVEHILLKAHDAGPICISLARQGAFRTICTVRRVEDAVASWIETFGFSETEAIEHVRTWIALYREIRNSALTIPYTLIDRRPWLAAWRVGKYLCPDISLSETRLIAHRYAKAEVKRQTDGLQNEGSSIQDIGFSYYDKTTFFHRRHVSSLKSRPADQRLSCDQLARIRNALTAEAASCGLA